MAASLRTRSCAGGEGGQSHCSLNKPAFSRMRTVHAQLVIGPVSIPDPQSHCQTSVRAVMPARHAKLFLSSSSGKAHELEIEKGAEGYPLFALLRLPTDTMIHDTCEIIRFQLVVRRNCTMEGVAVYLLHTAYSTGRSH